MAEKWPKWPLLPFHRGLAQITNGTRINTFGSLDPLPSCIFKQDFRCPKWPKTRLKIDKMVVEMAENTPILVVKLPHFGGFHPCTRDAEVSIWPLMTLDRAKGGQSGRNTRFSLNLVVFV